MKIQLACIALLAGTAAHASPFTTSDGDTKVNFIYTSTTGTDLIRSNGDVDNKGNVGVADGGPGGPKPSWSGNGFEILHQAYTFQAMHGLSSNTDVKFSLTYKQVENQGKIWPNEEMSKEGKYDDWSDFSVGVNHMFYGTDSLFASFSATYNGPAADYNPNVLITPGIESPEFVLGLSGAWVDQGLGVMAGLDVNQALRYGRAYDQTRTRVYLNYFGLDMVSFGLWYGMVSTGGDAIDIFSADWGTLELGDEGNVGGPFARLDEAFNYYGVSVSSAFGQYDVTFAYNAKLLDGAKNTDLNTGMSLAVGYSL